MTESISSHVPSQALAIIVLHFLQGQKVLR